jgi:hypothetical protein
MKEIKTIDVVRILQSAGHSVQWRKRTDGGIIITSIDGVKYKAAEGNKIAREMTGLALGENRQRALNVVNEKENREKGYTTRGRGRKKSKIDEEIKEIEAEIEAEIPKMKEYIAAVNEKKEEKERILMG